MDDVDDEETSKIAIVQSVDGSGCPVVRLAGELDLSNVDEVRPTLEEIIAKRPERLVLELSELSFMDSSGIALFVEISQLVGTLELDHPSRLIRRVLDATGVSDILKLKQ